MDWLTNTQQQLSLQIQQQRLPHALLISGGAQAGKAELVTWLAQVLQCQQPSLLDGVLTACGQCKHCHLIQSYTFPDNIVIDEAGSTVGVDAVRTATKFLETTPQIAQQKIVAISSVEDMSEAAANALLKTLEEPTKGNFLILSTANIDLLLPTIISRCQLVALRPQLVNQRALEQEPYANSSYLQDLDSQMLQQAYQDFTSHCLSFISQQHNLVQFERAVLEQERSLVWLERIVSHLVRVKNGWLAPKDNENLLNQTASSIDNDSLMRIFQLILASNQQIKDYAQVNTGMVKQRLVVDIAQVIAAKENEHG